MAGSWPLPTVLSSNPPAQGMVFPYPDNFGEAQGGRPRWCPSRAAEKRVVGVQLIGFPGSPPPPAFSDPRTKGPGQRVRLSEEVLGPPEPQVCPSLT